MKTLFRHPGIGGLLFAQSQVAFNDNATKLALIGLVQILLPKDTAAVIVSVIALLLVSPFVILAPMSGWLADRFQKRHVLSASLWLQLAVMLLLIGAALFQYLPLAVGGFFLLGAQSAFMSPARRGMIKELAGDSVGEVVGWMEMLCIAAILGGSLAGGQLIDGLTPLAGGAWSAAGWSFFVLALGCVLALWSFRKVPAHQPAAKTPFSWRQVLGHWGLMKTLGRDRRIWRAAWGDAAFYFAGGVLMLTLAEAGRALYPEGLGAARETGIMMATMGGGIAVGSLVAARLCRHQILTGVVPVAALGLAVVAFMLAALPAGIMAFYVMLFVLGLCGGLYLVPLGAFLVDRAPEEERGTILAASSMLSSIAGVLAVGAHALAKSAFQLDVPGQFVGLGIFFVLTSLFAVGMIPAETLRVLALVATKLRYQVVPVGNTNIPKTGGVLVVCNHVSYVDTLLLSMASNRPIRFLSYAGFFSMPVLGWILKIFGAIPVSQTRVKDAILKASDCIRQGEVVCIFPEGQLTRTGCLMEFKSGFELIARRAKCPVIVAHLDGVWGSIHSFEGGRYFTKWPQGLRRRVTVSFSQPLPTSEASTPRVLEEMMALGETAFRNRPLNHSLAQSLVGALRKNPFSVGLVDPSSRSRPFRNGEILAASLAFAKRWRSLPGRRVGVILPPGLGGTLTNLGLLFAGKVPVNLNPTLPQHAFVSCLNKARIETLITSRLVAKKFPELAMPAHVRWLESEKQEISSWSLISALMTGLISPTRWLCKTPCEPISEDEAIVLFTSGTSGLPKAAPLSNRRVLTNIHQFQETGFLIAEDRLLSALPLFHSFGLTVGLFIPLLSGKVLVTSPSALDCEALAQAAKVGEPTILLGTPTFLRTYARRISRDAFGHLRLGVAGAERLTPATAEMFQSRFGCKIYEGYGLTEASPVVAINQPDPPMGRGADTHQPGSKPGSVGRLLPGIAARFLDPETRLPVAGATQGILALRGGNLIENYLEEECPEKFLDGWLITGDMARIDEEGFLILEGRLSRFSKIGGEMVSHAAVEDAIIAAFPEADGTGRHCVLGIPNEEKGEELVLITSSDITRKDLLEKLALPNLCIPRRVVKVEKLPVLATGKLDLTACKAIIEKQSA